MKFKNLAHSFELLEKISSRIEMTKKLAELLSEADEQEIEIICNLAMGQLHAVYVGTQFNVAEKTMVKILSTLLAMSESQIKEYGTRHGDVADIILGRSYNPKQDLSVEQVYEYLVEIEKISGTGSQEERSKKIDELLNKVDSLSGKYIIRIILGKLRLGFSDMTIIDALSWMLTGDKSLHNEIEHAYNICADLGYIAALLKKKGPKVLDTVTIKVGIPIRPAAAERLPTAQAVLDKIGPCVAQPKLDGFRLQVHIDNRGKQKKMHFYSRNLQDMSEMFPDLKNALEQLDVETVIFEGEAIGYDVNTGQYLPFQETVKRKRKHGIEQAQEEFPLKLLAFDLLYLNDESYLAKTHETRRNALEKLFKKVTDKVTVDEEKVITNAKQLQDYFDEAIESGLEGLVVKRPNAQYQAGKRNFNWIKLKRETVGQLEDTIDCVVLGYYPGKGKRASFGIGAFLVGVFNKKQDLFQTIAKIGTGLTDEEWKELKKKADKVKIDHQPNNVECAKELAPFVWTSPEIVCEIQAEEITISPLHSAGKTPHQLGFALRFPRFVKYRTDKNPFQATTVEEIKRFYEDQFIKKKR